MSDLEVLDGRVRPRVVVSEDERSGISEESCVVKAIVEDEGTKFFCVGLGRDLPYRLSEVALGVILRC